MPAINVLYDFQIAVDTDFGVIKYIKTHPELNKPNFFKPALINGSEKDIIGNLLRRSTYNPLDAFARPDMIGKLDKVYEQLMTDPKYYSVILKLAHPTKALNLIYNSIKVPESAMNTSVMYYSDEELKFMVDVLKIPESVCVPFESQGSLDKYGNVCIKIYDDILKFDIESIKGKNIYIANYDFNTFKIDLGNNYQSIPKASVSKIIGTTNKINLIDIYNLDELK